MSVSILPAPVSYPGYKTERKEDSEWSSTQKLGVAVAVGVASFTACYFAVKDPLHIFQSCDSRFANFDLWNPRVISDQCFKKKSMGDILTMACSSYYKSMQCAGGFYKTYKDQISLMAVAGEKEVDWCKKSLFSSVLGENWSLFGNEIAPVCHGVMLDEKLFPKSEIAKFAIAAFNEGNDQLVKQLLPFFDLKKLKESNPDFVFSAAISTNDLELIKALNVQKLSPKAVADAISSTYAPDGDSELLAYLTSEKFVSLIRKTDYEDVLENAARSKDQALFNHIIKQKSFLENQHNFNSVLKILFVRKDLVGADKLLDMNAIKDKNGNLSRPPRQLPLSFCSQAIKAGDLEALKILEKVYSFSYKGKYGEAYKLSYALALKKEIRGVFESGNKELIEFVLSKIDPLSIEKVNDLIQTISNQVAYEILQKLFFLEEAE